MPIDFYIAKRKSDEKIRTVCLPSLYGIDIYYIQSNEQ